MKKFKIFILAFIVSSALSSCGTVKDGFTNQKKNNSDEFLVEKKSPLIMPPNYDDLPEPKLQNIPNDINKNQIKDLIVKTEEVDKNSDNLKDVNGTFEETLIEKIKNN